MMADGSNGNRGQTFLWQCKYCPKSFPGAPSPDAFDFCPKCGKEQKQEPLIPEIVCINPECKATLFSEKAKTCHICKEPQQQKTAATPTDSSKHGSIEEHKVMIAQAVESKKQQSQEPETTKEVAASRGAGRVAGNQLAAEPQKRGAQIPPNTPKQGETPEDPIVIDSTNGTVPDKGMSTEAAETAKDVNKSATEGTTKDGGNRFQERMSGNVNVDGQKTSKGTSSDVGDPAPAKKKAGTQDQPPSGPAMQNPSSGVPSPDSNKLVPDSDTYMKSTDPGVPDNDLARMSIDDSRTQNRKRGHEGEGDHPTGGSSTPSTYAAAAKTPATTTQPSQTQLSVPPVTKKQRNNTTNDRESNSGPTTHPLSNLNQSTDPQVCVIPK
jgi:hypothetical protein